VDNERIRRALLIDAGWTRATHDIWLALMDLVVWGDLNASRLGVVPRVRKRALDLGEKLKSLGANRDWIPHPRERLKSALASALHLRTSLEEFARVAGELDGGADLTPLRAHLQEMQRLVLAISAHEEQWARLLDAQYLDE
jgi:hypothetical protein